MSLTTIESIFVRKRNALMVRGHFPGIYTDYYLHLMEHGIRPPPVLDQMLKDALATLTLHLVTRPWAETSAWTVNLRAPRVNLFVTGSSLTESVTGRVFTEDVREPDRNYFYSQATTPNSQEPRTSTIEVDGNDPVNWITRFYLQSEQRHARCFRLPDEHFMLVSAQPDCDLDWLLDLTDSAAAEIPSANDTKLLETRRFRFFCGCNLDRILPILGSWRDRLDELFQDADLITLQCPRCAAKYPVSRDMVRQSR